MATYELWDMHIGNLVGSWPSESDALGVVRDALGRHGADAVAFLSLLVEDADGHTSLIAEGPTLIQRARQLAPSRGQRSA